MNMRSRTIQEWTTKIRKMKLRCVRYIAPLWAWQYDKDERNLPLATLVKSFFSNDSLFQNTIDEYQKSGQWHSFGRRRRLGEMGMLTIFYASFYALFPSVIIPCSKSTSTMSIYYSTLSDMLCRS